MVDKDLENQTDFTNQETDTEQTNTTSEENNLADQEKYELLESELKISKLELEDWKERATRLSADLQNILRQHELDLVQAKKSSKKSVLLVIITFINTLNLAFSFAPKTTDEEFNKFTNTLKNSLDRVIEDFRSGGVEIIIPLVGSTFDAEYMNILNPDSAVNNDQEIFVKQVVSCGLKIDNQLVQPANIMI